MPRYVQVWFLCDALGCGARTEELIQMDTHPHRDYPRAVPAGWRDWNLAGVVSDVLVCPECMKRIETAPRGLSPAAVANMFPEQFRYPQIGRYPMVTGSTLAYGNQPGGAISYGTQPMLERASRAVGVISNPNAVTFGTHLPTTPGKDYPPR